MEERAGDVGSQFWIYNCILKNTRKKITIVGRKEERLLFLWLQVFCLQRVLTQASIQKYQAPIFGHLSSVLPLSFLPSVVTLRGRIWGEWGLGRDLNGDIMPQAPSSSDIFSRCAYLCSLDINCSPRRFTASTWKLTILLMVKEGCCCG